MNSVLIDRRSMSELRKQAGPAAIAFGLWLRIAIAGAAAIAGLFLAFDNAPSALLALALVLGGGVLAAVGWRRAVNILYAADGMT